MILQCNILRTHTHTHTVCDVSRNAFVRCISTFSASARRERDLRCVLLLLMHFSLLVLDSSRPELKFTIKRSHAVLYEMNDDVKTLQLNAHENKDQRISSSAFDTMTVNVLYCPPDTTLSSGEVSKKCLYISTR